MFSDEQLTSPDFDEVSYLRYALRAASYSTEHARLEHRIAEVKAGMQSILADHADELIDQARCTHRAQREVSTVRQSTDSLQKASGRLRLMIEEPYMQLQSRVRELEATQEAAQLLQSALRFLSLTARLQEQLAAAPSMDLIRASYTLREVEEVLQEGAIRSLQMVDAQLPAVERYATTIRGKAHELLAMTELTSVGGGGAAAGPTSATTTTSISRLAANVSTGLQCAYVLRMVSRTVQGFMTERRREVLRTVMRELDIQTIEEHISAEYDRLSRASQGNNASPNGGGGAVSEQAVTAHVVLEHIQKTLFIAVQHTQCVILLWRLLLQKRDAQTQAPYLASIESPVQLLVEHWTTITEKLRERLNSLQKRHAIRLALATAYPRYHHLMASFLSRTEAVGVTETSLGITSGNNANAAGTGGNSASATLSNAAALLSSIHVTQCGMGDFLDVIDLVDAEVRRGGSLDEPPAAGESAGVLLSRTCYPNNGIGAAAAAAVAAPPRTDTQDLRHTWLAQVTDELRDSFRTVMMDRHRELISGVFIRLSSITPASPAMCGQPATVAPVRAQGIRRPAIPPQANALDLTTYTRMITHEVQVFRQDPHTLDVLLDCVLSTLRQVRSKFGEATKKYPLPPLPAITASPTVVQILHLCIVNGCTTLAYDGATVLACVPQPSAWADGGSSSDGNAVVASGGRGSDTAPGGVHHASSHDPYAVVLEQLGNKRMELQQLIHGFHEMAERSSKPFVDSAMDVLLPALTQATDSVLRNELAATAAATFNDNGARGLVLGAGDSRTALVQLQSQCRQFTDRFFFLVDSRTWGWVEACQRMTDKLLSRLLSRLSTTTPPAPLRGNLAAVAPAFGRTIQLVMPSLLQYIQVIQSAGAVGRTTSLLRGCVRQVEGYYDACAGLSQVGDGASAAAMRATVLERLRPPVPPLFAKLLLLQYALFRVSVPHEAAAATASSAALASLLNMSEQEAAESVEGLLLRDSTANAVIATPSPSSAGAATPVVDDSKVARAVEDGFRQVVASASAETAPGLLELWSSAASH